MAFELIRPGHSRSILAASFIGGRVPVMYSGTNVLAIVPCGSANDRPIGMSGPAGASNAGVDLLEVREMTNIVKAVAGASIGVGVPVTLGSTNGALIPAIAASAHWEIGTSETQANAGEVFSLYVNPRK